MTQDRKDKSAEDTSQAWLDDAYAISTPGDARAYYADFAQSYDQEFAEALGYCYPRIIAERLHNTAVDDDQPVADIGCGTGLIAEALPGAMVMDGFDISPEMLAIAREKALYRDLYTCDITGNLAQFATGYGAITSAGTFTHGHLGPEPLENLLVMAKPGALFVIGVNQAHFKAEGFAPVLDAMVERGAITRPECDETAIYDRAGHAHAQDRALVLTYRKCS